MAYQKVTQEDVYQRMVRLSLDYMNPIGGAINLKTLAFMLQTSRYQVKKYMDELYQKGFVQLKSFNLSTEDELYPPYWGYLLTEKGKDTDYYREREKEEDKIFHECFNS
jgi:Mn-dependent DtxR family transcriptional regulator